MDTVKRATNTFVGGMITDRHPLTAQNKELIDARNIDLAQVGEGYQLVLQKREGNTELLYTPAAWDSTIIYLIDEYVLYNDVVYKSLQDANEDNTPDSVPTYWEAILTLAPAGLRDGYIPLVVKEFNNVAYIISVDPITGSGEIGTFPSPDYTEFKYKIGIEESPPTIEAFIWDPTAISPDYGFSIVGTSEDYGTEEIVPGNAEVDRVLGHSGFLLTNTGLLQDVFTITFDAADANVAMYANEELYDTVYPSGISLSSGESKTITFKLADPYAVTPSTTFTNFVTVAPTDGNESSATSDIIYSTTISFQISTIGGWGSSFVDGQWTTSDSTYNHMEASVTDPNYLWRSNGTVSTITCPDYTPGSSGIVIGDPFDYNPTTILINIAANTDPVPRTGTWTILVTYDTADTFTMTVELIQAYYPF